MVRRVSVTDSTHRRLQLRQRKGETLGETIDRLLDTAPKDPWIFLNGPKSRMNPDERIRQIEADRDAQWEKA